MAIRFFAAAILAACMGASWASDDVQVTIKGVLNEDKNGFYVRANGGMFDLYFTEEGRADMRKFHSSLQGDMVQVSGTLNVREHNGKTFLNVYASDIKRMKGERAVTETTTTTTVVPAAPPPPPVVVRERYVERDHSGIHLPGIHIHW